jgi:aerobic-type carbon monoxide dehydrogenase small subunit (CoxS/CutS family)
MPNVSTLNVNGKSLSLDADPARPLLSVLRDDLAFFGPKYGCGEGQCGACTVLVDGTPTRSCVTPVSAIGSKKIVTIEGLERNGELHPVQQAFLDASAMQCGYCTSGMILSGVALLEKNPNPSTNEMIRAMQGNICRCGTYPRILRALSAAAKKMKKSAASPDFPKFEKIA